MRDTRATTHLHFPFKVSRPQQRNGEQDKQKTPPQLPDAASCILKTPFAVTFGLIRMSGASAGCSPATLRLRLIILSPLMTVADGAEVAATAGCRPTPAELWIIHKVALA